MTPQPLSPNPPLLSGQHLSEEQLSDCLSGSTPAAAQQHLDRCTTCQAELAELRSAISGLDDMSLAWAEQRAATHIPVPSRATLRWHRAPVWSSIAAALCAVVFLFAQHHQQHPTASAAPIATASTLPTAAAQVASTSPDEDDSLLLAIDQEIKVGQQSPVSAAALGLSHQAGSSSASGGLDN